jgi:hypothetical protein
MFFCTSSWGTYDEAADWILAETYFATCYACSLHGPEGLLVDQIVLPENIKQGDPHEIIVPLLGKVKG